MNDIDVLMSAVRVIEVTRLAWSLERRSEDRPSHHELLQHWTMLESVVKPYPVPSSNVRDFRSLLVS